MSDGWVLGVDLGTSHTVAMLRRPDGRTRPLLFDGQPLLPSAVYLDTTGRLHVGRDAVRLGQAEPGRLEPNPKRHVDAETVLLGGAEVPTADLLAALLGAVSREAVAAAGFLPPAVLTYPAAWGTRRRAVLTTALARAGWPPATQLLPEPVAAARYFADVLRRPVPVGSALAVFDFGGGTLDIAVVRNEGVTPQGLPRFAVAASGGIDDLGGLDLDAALVEHLGDDLRKGEPAAWTALTEPVTLAQWRARRQFWDDVRGAKEMLSRTALAPVPVPGVEHAVHLTRDEFEAAAGPLLRRGVAEAESVIRAAGVAPTELAGLFLVGGSSRVPLVARLLHGELGIAPTVLEQPELPVAEGATIVVAPGGPAAEAGPDTAAGADHAETPAEPMRPAAVPPPVDTMAHAVTAPAARAADDTSRAGQTDADAAGHDSPDEARQDASKPLLATEAMEPTAAATDPDLAGRAHAPTPAAAHSAGAAQAGPAHAAEGSAGVAQAGAAHAAGVAQAGPAHAAGGSAGAAQAGAAHAAGVAQAGPAHAAGSPAGAAQASLAHAAGSPASAAQAGAGQASPAHAAPPAAPAPPPAAPPPPGAEPQYAEPVDPWATGEAAAFGNATGGPILHPVSGAPISASPASAPPESWLASTHPDPGGSAEAKAKLPAYRRKGLWIVAAATVVVLGAAATVTALFWPGYPALDYQPLAELHRIKPAVPVTTAFNATALRDGRAYFASVDDNGTLGVVAAATDTGKAVWTSVEAGTASRWEFFFAVPDAVVAITDSDSTTSTRRMVLLNPGDGKKLWERTIDTGDDVLFAGDKAVLIDRREGRLVGLEIRKRGNGRWEKKNPKSQYGLTGTKVVTVTTGADFTGPASAGGAPFAEAFDDDQRIVQIGADDSARVLDADSGDVLVGPRQSVAKTDDQLIAHDGRLIVAESTDAHRLFAYDLAKLDPKVLYTPPSANARLDHLTPCGTDRICLVETTGYATDTAQVVAIDAAKGGVVWRRTVAGVDRIVPVGEAVLATADTSPVQVSLLDAKGRVSWTRGGVVGRLDAGNTLQFSKALSASADDPALAGEHLGDNAVPLGPLDGVRSSTCSWDTTHLACVAAEDFVIQRFAG
ncbi:Hsp70 family protein [Actinoplanes sp. NPDC049599]|uniref:Hsp70 family protein n=1 Tax=Actinoplanes sp. NPDC049599 TaxID=3363903 RepID=UPI00379E339F